MNWWEHHLLFSLFMKFQWRFIENSFGKFTWNMFIDRFWHMKPNKIHNSIFDATQRLHTYKTVSHRVSLLCVLENRYLWMDKMMFWRVAMPSDERQQCVSVFVEKRKRKRSERSRQSIHTATRKETKTSEVEKKKNYTASHQTENISLWIQSITVAAIFTINRVLYFEFRRL